MLVNRKKKLLVRVSNAVDPAVIYNRRDEIVAAEQASRAAWEEFDDEKRAGVLACIRETLLRLLESPDWVPGSFSYDGTGNRLDVTFVVQLEEMEGALERAGWRAEQDAALRRTLMRMSERLDGTAT